jgi:hypothetical protein
MPNGYVVGPRSSYIVPNDVVGNFFAGQDAGYARAKEQFADRQAVETQNALVQMTPEAQSYAQLQAMQMQAKQYADTFTPILNSAISNKNMDLVKKVAEAYRGSNNPALGKLADAIDSIQFLDKNKYKVRYTFGSQEEVDAFRQKNRTAANHPQIPLNTLVEIDLEGPLGDPNSVIHAITPVKIPASEKQARVKNTTVSSVAGIDALLARVPKDSPNREIIAQQLADAKKKISSTQRVAIEVDDNLVPTGRWDLEGGAGGAGGGSPHFTPMGTTVIDGKTKMLSFDMRGNKIDVVDIPGDAVPGVKGQKHLPAEQADALGKLKEAHENVALVREAWNETLTGAFEGRVNEALQHIKNDPKFESLRRRTNQLITVAYGLSGKQISAKEIQLLKESILPDVRQMDQNFLTALDELEAWIQRNGDSVQDAFEKAHYDFERVDFGGKRTAAKASGKGNIAPAGTKAKLRDGRIVVSDGKGGWK